MKKSSVLMLVLVILLFSFLASNTILDGYAFFDATTTTDTDISVAISSKFMQSTMSFDTNGGSSITPLTGYVDDPITPPSDPTKSGYAFDGWYSDTSLTTPYTISTYPFNDITLYAKWVTSKLYTITFDSNGGSAVSSITQNYGTTVSAPTDPTMTGYTFAGWFSDVALTQSYTFSTMPAENITLYAGWATAGLSFTTTTGGYSVSKGSSSAGGELIIPASYNGTPIVEIGSFKTILQ